MFRKMIWMVIGLSLLSGLTVMPAQSASIPAEVYLTDADMTFLGEQNEDWAGYFASPAGDVNGDGLGDILIGAPMAGNKICPTGESVEDCVGIAKGEGVGYLVLGKPNNEWPASPMDLANADASFLGCAVRSMTSRQLYTAGDVNGDGYDDMLFSGWKCGENYTGKIFLVLGRPDADWGQYFLLVTQADASFLGENEYDFTGYYVSTAGDVNGDGYDDILITSPRNNQAGTEAGRVYLIYGKENPDWGLDFPLANADVAFYGDEPEDRIGRAATSAGDVNADGFDDFIIGSISSDDGGIDAGETFLVLGEAAPTWGPESAISSAAAASFIGEADGDETGRRVARAGDVNGDGYDDIIIGGSRNDEAGRDAGKTYLILGSAAADWGLDFPLAQADAIFLGEDRDDQSGRRVSSAGDANNDGYDDFLIGAPHSDRNGELSGTAYLIYGRPEADWGTNFSLSDADVAYLGKPDVGVAGYDVAWVGDFNGDQTDDFIIAAFGGREDFVTPGETYLILGNAAPELEILSPPPDSIFNYGEVISFSASAVDSVDGDLSADIIWTSSRDGVFGTGAGFDYSTLSSGNHIITASVTDSGNLTAASSIRIKVRQNFPPEAISFTSVAPDGLPFVYQRFVNVFLDDNGSQDIAQVQMVMENGANPLLNLNVRYDQQANQLYLYDYAVSDWVGPCTPGDFVYLKNSTVKLDCANSGVRTSLRTLKLIVRLKWTVDVPAPVVFDVLLRAEDIHGLDSGFVNFGTWTLLPAE